MTQQPRRGRLRLYLGAAPGVGKTYAMLSEARRRTQRGTDVVAAAVEGRRGVTEERREGRCSYAVGAVRLLEGLQQGDPLRGGRGVEDRPAGVDHRRHTDRGQRVLDGLELDEEMRHRLCGSADGRHGLVPEQTFSGPTVIAFVEDPDGYKIELIERK